MNSFIDLWMTWAHLFRPLPYHDYVAAFVLVGGVVYATKKLKSFARYV